MLEAENKPKTPRTTLMLHTHNAEERKWL